MKPFYPKAVVFKTFFAMHIAVCVKRWLTTVEVRIILKFEIDVDGFHLLLV